jgi:hypothetical protein
MNIHLKLTGRLYEEMIQDLLRPHPFAAERVGFVFGRMAALTESSRLLLLTRYHAVADGQYIDDRAVGARIGPDAITWATQAVYYGRPTSEGIFHVHIHGNSGEPGMSDTDRREIPALIPGFQSVGRTAAHGIIILSADHGAAWVWFPGQKENCRAGSISVIGSPVAVFERKGAGHEK